MVKYIKSLTDEQRAALDDHVKMWINYGWSTEPADWDLFEDAARRRYELAGLPWHRKAIHVASPLAMAISAPTSAWLLQYMKDNKISKEEMTDERLQKILDDNNA